MDTMYTKEFIEHYKRATGRGGCGKERYIHRINFRMLQSLIPQGAKILAIGPRLSFFVHELDRSISGWVADPYAGGVRENREERFRYFKAPEELPEADEKADYIILSFAIGMMEDITQTLRELRRFCHGRTRFIITYYNKFWQPAVKLAEWMGWKSAAPKTNWVPIREIENFMFLSDIQMIKRGTFCIMPVQVPFFSDFMNRFLGTLPLIDRLGALSVVLGRVAGIPFAGRGASVSPSVSVIVPARNEEGNIRQILRRFPEWNYDTEIIFVEGGSGDKTRRVIEDVIRENPQRDIKLLIQDGRGKKDAVQKGFLAARGDILAILDADIAVAPEMLPLFVEAIVSGKGEFINGSRMVYPMRGKAMRFINFLGNKFFSYCFSYLMGQRVDDTLCGTKVLLRRDYLDILENSVYFSHWDPFGDFDLLFGATYLNLKIVDLPVRYTERVYGATNINRWRDGAILLKMVMLGAFKLKFHSLANRPPMIRVRQNRRDTHVPEQEVSAT